MKLIRTITDQDFLASNLMSEAKPRDTVRTLLFNEEGKIAVMHVSRYQLYSFPGGGVESGESLEEALKREILEETGCCCEIIQELGYIKENRGLLDYTQQSYYYVTQKLGEAQKPILTITEVNNGTSYAWYEINEVMNLLMLTAHETLQQKYLQARDLAALEEYLTIVKGN
ncbi:MAG: ADP-ribose pyrophosphatase [Herbinix sp.]|nr:ADP-ribose pyrophosphatase [Herbinix sp.]